MSCLKSVVVFAFVLGAVGVSAGAQAYKVTNIISDGSVPAPAIEPNFINPWAISSSGTWWISAEGTGYNYVVPSTGATAGTKSFAVIVPTAKSPNTSPGFPAGSVTTAGASGMILPNGTKASFIFSTLDGTISGWNSKLGTNNAVSQVVINNSAAGASYPGLAILNTSTSSYVLAPDFGTGTAVEVYDNTFKPTKLAGSFTDPNLPANYAPYAIHILGTQIFVTYALRSANLPYTTVTGSGFGIVSVFDTSGNFVARVVTGGNLNAPWGVAFAPANFGIFSNDLLVGNFGDGKINVYDPKSYAYLGQLMDNTGKSLAYASLWELLTGATGGSGGDASTVYFTAGLTNEAHGLFAGITNGTTSGSTPTFGFTASQGAAAVNRGSSVQAIVSVVPANGFSGNVTLACNGLPSGATCSFSPSQITVAANAIATATVTIQTAGSASVRPRYLRGTYGAGIASALLLPLASIVVARRRRLSSIRLLSVMFVFLACVGFVVGCSDSGTKTVSGTPTGQSSVVIAATSGSIAQQSTIALTVQ